ncbi:LysE family translocator [Pseudomonas sp. TH21]|uniref:LysE family translocator n=1 Tax=Pseudomonas sp. TH21 TaxID=2796387 RepID=UPI000EA09C58|nr:LysE family translocator [Pseudomonas sp. TH21]AYF49147.1 LysE family translocator [Pseudomonas fluorescens]MBK5477572.1 LysE family translocator [Pseudomonas sp. TH21]QTV16786.1 LysE family translocator [Pseudomonas fluorescens]
MDTHSILAFTLVAAIAIASPGPAILMALNNSLAYGARSTLWSTAGNASGLFCMSAAAMLGLGALIISSEWVFNAVKVLGAGYLFYLGASNLLKKSGTLAPGSQGPARVNPPSRWKLYKLAFLTAVTNPKAVLFFTALFPQFLNQHAPLVPQFLVLTLIFILLSALSLSLYALLASQAKGWLARPVFSRWVNRVVGATFIGFGAALLSLRRQTL